MKYINISNCFGQLNSSHYDIIEQYINEGVDYEDEKKKVLDGNSEAILDEKLIPIVTSDLVLYALQKTNDFTNLYQRLSQKYGDEFVNKMVVKNDCKTTCKSNFFI